ncbi:MAG: choice-of-anchor Q domain-containing protein [Roseiflexus sp.]
MHHSRAFSLATIFFVITLAAGWLLSAPSSRAATFTIPCGDVTALITAITTANSNNQPDTIDLATGCTYSLTTVDNTVGGSANGLPAIIVDSGNPMNSLTINGNGATIERAAGSPSFRLLYLTGVAVTINDLNFRNGYAEDDEGGAIRARNSDLTLNRVTFEGNRATYDGGALVARDSNLTLNRVTFEGNRAGSDGGALYTVSVTANLSDSIFRNNQSGTDGGAIAFRVDGPGQATISGTTFSGNQATGGGGAIAAFHEITVQNSTFSNNQADGDGGAVLSNDSAVIAYTTITSTQTGGDGALNGSITLRSALVAGNTDTSASPGNYPDIAGSITSDGYNLIGNVGDYDFAVNTTGDQYGDPNGTTIPNSGAVESPAPIDPLLAPLANNGGPTPTHALLAGSPALNRIPGGTNDCGGAIAIDQRDISRPQDGACDVGAFEAIPAPEIAVYNGPDASSPELTNNQTTAVDFGATTVGAPISRVFAIRNAGTAPLTLGALTLPSGFAVVGAFPTGPVVAGATVTFTVQLTAVAAGVFSGTLSFVNGDADENPFQFPIGGVVTAATPTLQQTYLPLIVQPGQPDLIIAGIEIIPNQTSFTAGQPVEIRVTVKNVGTAPAGPFWVDLYLNPDRPPQTNDLWHDRCTLRPCFGVAWGVTQILQPGEQITLSTGSGYDPLRTYWLGWLANGTTTIYALADSWNTVGTSGAVIESDETNNRGVRDGLTVSGANPPAPPWKPSVLAGAAQESLLPERPAYDGTFHAER